MNGLDGLGYRDKTVVLTGGASGMGEAAAKILGELGAKVHIVDIQQPKVPHAGFYQCDLSDPEQVSATAQALQDLAPIDFLFPCAGIPPHTLGPLKCMLVNYVGTRQFVEAMLPALAKGAGIALISSTAGAEWQKNLVQNIEMLAITDPAEARRWCEASPDKLRDGYTTSKEMLIVWLQALAPKIGREQGIRINAIAPCPTATAFMDVTIDRVGKAYFETYPYPLLGRMATAEEQAWPLVMLNSPLNKAVTGTVLFTDQGNLAGRDDTARVIEQAVG
jgi:NAD(P)-dependent dehydrogenase (short-subunit alcohol dehydrogenase family)